MKRISIFIAGFGIAATAIPATALAAAPAPAVHASAQGGPWHASNARQNRIEARINQGIRSGAINRREATRLRSELRKIERLEVQYRRSRPGLTMAERRDLDRRFDALERSIRIAMMDDRRPGHHRGPGYR